MRAAPGAEKRADPAMSSMPLARHAGRWERRRGCCPHMWAMKTTTPCRCPCRCRCRCRMLGWLAVGESVPSVMWTCSQLSLRRNQPRRKCICRPPQQTRTMRAPFASLQLADWCRHSTWPFGDASAPESEEKERRTATHNKSEASPARCAWGSRW